MESSNFNFPLSIHNSATFGLDKTKKSKSFNNFNNLFKEKQSLSRSRSLNKSVGYGGRQRETSENYNDIYDDNGN